jgi:hypothetical protein
LDRLGLKAQNEVHVRGKIADHAPGRSLCSFMGITPVLAEEVEIRRS